MGSNVVMLVVGLLLGLVLGGLVAWLVVRSRAQVVSAAAAAERAGVAAEAERARSESARARADAADARAELATARSDAAGWRAEAERAKADLARMGTAEAHRDAAVAQVRTEATEAIAQARNAHSEAVAEAARVHAKLTGVLAERDAAVTRAEELAADREALVLQFKTLSAEQLERQGKQADHTAEQRLRATEALMSPVKDSLERMNQRLTEVEKERAAIAADMRSQVQSVIATGDNLRRETAALVTALRKPQVRGAWGETQLKRVAEITGMVERCDFEVQVSSETDDGRRRPDMRVNLADGKVAFVDSKVPLSAFMDAFETEDDAVRGQHLDTFARHVRTHIDQLSGKNYWRLDTGSPEFVVLFLPSEAFLQAALERSTDLQEYAARKDIMLATPSILIPLLRAIQHGWKQAALAQSAAEVAALGRELHERLGTMGSHFDKLGRQLTGAVKAYNATLGSLEGRVMVTARKFQDYEVAGSELPELTASAESVKVITAPELVDSAAQVDTTLGRLPRRERAASTEIGDAERAQLTRPQPSLDELLDDEPAAPGVVELKRQA